MPASLFLQLRKIIQTPDFPGKRNPHLRTKPAEQRRQELEEYLQVPTELVSREPSGLHGDSLFSLDLIQNCRTESVLTYICPGHHLPE